MVLFLIFNEDGILLNIAEIEKSQENIESWGLKFWNLLKNNIKHIVERIFPLLLLFDSFSWSSRHRVESSSIQT